MFVSKARHESELKLLELSASQREVLYHNQVRILEDHIESLKRLVFAPVSKEPSAALLEVDRALSPNEDSPSLSMPEEDEAVLRERDKLFAGAWDEVSE